MTGIRRDTCGAAVVVGGTGFLGSRLVARLAEEGRPIRVVSRSAPVPGSLPAGVEHVAADLERDEAVPELRRAVRGASGVVHLAGALFRPKEAASRYRRLHVDGTARLLSALRDAGSPVRLVHVSTTGVLGPTGPDPLDEAAPPRPTTLYESTKLEGERLALSSRGDGVEVVAVRPGLVYGPGDRHLAALWRAIRDGRFRPVGGGRALWQPVHVDDVARGLSLSLSSPALDGEIFHLAGSERVTVRDFAGRIARSLGTRLRGPSLPFALAWAAGGVLELACAPFGLDPPMSRSRARTLTEHRVYSIVRARERLGWSPAIPLDRGVEKTTAWYRTEGLL